MISDANYELEGVRVENVRWSIESQEAELSRLDIGIMPLEDTPWSRGKCAYKLLQYMAAGVLGVGSAVGMNKEVIMDGENGLLVRNCADWEPVLEGALDDIDMRLRIGAEGRRSIATDHTYQNTARRWLNFFQMIRDRR